MSGSSPYALITGSSGGIGQALVKGFHEAGYRVIATDMTPPPDDIPAVHFIEADLIRVVEDVDYAEAVFQQFYSVIGHDGLKVLVNNAALQIVKPTEELTVKDWTRSLNVNVLAPFLLVKALLPQLKSAGGSVVNISSIHATLTKPGFVAYASSKATLSALTRSLAVELGASVRVNAISPAAIDTPMLKAGFAGREQELDFVEQMHPVGRLGKPDEVAALAVFLASESAGFITGSEFALHGGIGGRLRDPV